MSVTPLQRAALAWAARPPGPPAFWYAVGSAMRGIGATLDSIGTGVMGASATVEKRARHAACQPPSARGALSGPLLCHGRHLCLLPPGHRLCQLPPGRLLALADALALACFIAVPIPTTAIKLGGKAPAVAGASFIAPSANLVGAVVMGEGASAWYGAMIKGGASAAEIGELSSVGDRAVVVDSILGKCVHVGAGAIVTGAKIADESSIGMGCKVGKGASIGSGAALAAGSVLPPGASVPAGQLWGGIPAKKISDLGADAAAAMVRTCEVTCDLGKLHMDESWKELDLVEEEAEDRKREKTRTPERLETMRDDPKWVPMPSLGEHLAKMGVHSHTHVPP